MASDIYLYGRIRIASDNTNKVIIVIPGMMKLNVLTQYLELITTFGDNAYQAQRQAMKENAWKK